MVRDRQLSEVGVCSVLLRETQWDKAMSSEWHSRQHQGRDSVWKQPMNRVRAEGKPREELPALAG